MLSVLSVHTGRWDLIPLSSHYVLKVLIVCSISGVLRPRAFSSNKCQAAQEFYQLLRLTIDCYLFFILLAMAFTQMMSTAALGCTFGVIALNYIVCQTKTNKQATNDDYVNYGRSYEAP